MRILLCVHHPLDANTGAPGITLQLGDEYRALGHEVEFLSFDDLPARLRGPAAELTFPEAAALMLARRGRRFDVVDATTGDAWLWARLDRSGRRARLVTRSHGLEHVYWREAVEEARAEGRRLPLRTRLYHGGIRLREVAASLRASDRCVFSNHPDLEFAVEGLGVARDRASVVLNGIAPELEGLRLTGAGDTLGVAMIGTWASRKGARYAAEALSRLVRERDDVRVLLLGTRVTARRVLADFDESARASVRVVQSYERAELPSLLRDSQVLLSASLAEGFSVAIPEGMAAGLAPVASALPGTREIVRDGENGLLVPPRDSGALAEGVLRLAADRGLLERLRRAAHADAQELTWRRIAERNLEVYAEAGAR
jgi:glycosyltransferase involved in cell wall biosynthesis